MATNFHVGQKVVCVDAKHHSWMKVPFLFFFERTVFDDSYLVEGEVYTIQKIYTGNCTLTGKEVVAVLLVEDDSDLGGFRVDRFRPLVTRKTDISIFRKILKSPKIPIPA